MDADFEQLVKDARARKEAQNNPDTNVPTVDLSRLVGDPTKGDMDFISLYCSATNQDTIPPVFNLAAALVLVSCAVGHNIQINDFRPVFGNIAIVLTGSTGAGKTRATWHMTDTLRMAFLADPRAPYDPDNVVIIKDPGSDEYLVDEHYHEQHAVKSLIQFNELSKLISQAKRQGSTIMERLFDFLDTEKVIETGSRGKGKKRAHNAYASFISTTQPERLSKVLTGDDVAFGAVNRFNFVFGTETPSDILNENAIKIELGTAAARLKMLHHWTTTQLPDPTKPAPVGQPFMPKVDEDAKEELNRWNLEWLEPRKRSEMSSLLNRLDLQVKKYTLLFAVNAESDIIRLAHVRQAIVWVEFLYECYAQVDTRLGSTKFMEQTDFILRIIAKIEAAGKDITTHNIMQHTRKVDNRTLKLIMDGLTDVGMFELIKVKGEKGRPKLYYQRVE